MFLHLDLCTVLMDGIVRCRLKSLHISRTFREVVEEQVAFSSTCNARMIADHRRYACIYLVLVVNSSLGLFFLNYKCARSFKLNVQLLKFLHLNRPGRIEVILLIRFLASLQGYNSRSYGLPPPARRYNWN